MFESPSTGIDNQIRVCLIFFQSASILFSPYQNWYAKVWEIVQWYILDVDTMKFGK